MFRFKKFYWKKKNKKKKLKTPSLFHFFFFFVFCWLAVKNLCTHLYVHTCMFILQLLLYCLLYCVCAIIVEMNCVCICISLCVCVCVSVWNEMFDYHWTTILIVSCHSQSCYMEFHFISVLFSFFLPFLFDVLEWFLYCLGRIWKLFLGLST